MTRENKLVAAAIGCLALIVGIGAYELNQNKNQSVTTTRSVTESVPVSPSPVLGSRVAPAAMQPVPITAVIPVAPTSRVTETVVQPVRGIAAPTPYPATNNTSAPYAAQSPAYVPTAPYAVGEPSQLQPQQAMMAPTATETVVNTRPGSQVVTQRTTAYVPAETSTSVYRVYVHKRIQRHQKSGNIHVARAVKHTVMFAVKMPGRLRL